MATLAEIRSQYPQYSDMSDADLAGALHAKFYSDMPVEEFNQKVGLTAAPNKKIPASAPSEIPTPRQESTLGYYGRAVTAPFAGVKRGFQDITDTAVLLLSKGVDKVAGDDFMSKSVQAEIDRQKAAYEQQYGEFGGGDVGRLAGSVVGTVPVGGALAAPVKKAVEMAPSLAKYLAPVATALESGGFKTGLESGLTSTGVKIVGGGTTGAASAAAVNPDDAAVGGAIGALLPSVIAPVAGKVLDYGRKLADLKGTNYLEAVEGKGREIINLLRSPTAAKVPGSAPIAGEVAAPAGSTKFSAMQANMARLPEVATEYAESAAQTNAARIAQEARVKDLREGAFKKVLDKIDRSLTNVSQRETGTALLAAARAEQEAVKKGVIQPAYTAAYKAAGDTKIDVSSVVKTAENILERKLSDFAPETAPNTVRKLLALKPKSEPAAPLGKGKVSSKIVRPASEPTAPAEATLQQLDDIRKAINADIQAAKTSLVPSSDMTLRNLYKLHESIDDAIGKSGNLSDEAKTLYAKAVQTYRTEYVPRFKTGVNANLFKQTSLNEPKIMADDVVGKYFQPRGEREAEQFITMFGKNPDALKVTKAGIEDLYRQKVVDATTGRVNMAKHAAFMKDYARPIALLDDAGMGLRQGFDAIGADAARLSRIQELIDKTGNKLRPPLPPGSNAMLVEKRIAEITKNLPPEQLRAVNAVRDDLAREAEYIRLAQLGGAGDQGKAIVSKAATEAGLPAPSLLSVPITIFNNVVKRLSLKMDSKLALEIARELTNPALAAQSIENATKRKFGQEVTDEMLRLAAPSVSRAASQVPADRNNLPHFTGSGVNNLRK
jgi:hypothetical protein